MAGSDYRQDEGLRGWYPQPVLACQRHQDPWLLVPFLTGNTVETWILLGEHLRNTLLEIRFYLFFGGCYTIWFDWFRTERTSSALVSEQKIWIIWLQWLVPQIRSIAFGIGTYDLKIHAGNPQNILLLWLILQQNAPGYCAFRWRESPLSGMNALMDFNSKHKHEATPGRWKSASRVFQGVAVDIVIYEQMNWSPMVFHQSRVWGFAACANGVILPVRSSDGVVPGVSGLES